MGYNFNFPSDLKSLLPFLLIPMIGGSLGAIITSSQINGWYRTIRKPSWNPPDWLFGPVWTVLYLAMGVCSWLVFKWDDSWDAGLTMFVIQVVLNWLWTPIFFQLHWLGWASLEIVAMLAAIIATVVLFIIKIGPMYPLVLMGPYILWVSFASCLTIWIWWHNRPGASTSSSTGAEEADVVKPEQEAVQPAEQL